MAELNQNNSAVQSKKYRVKKIAPKVDLTAMVDLAFLLITFFMLTTSLNKPQSLDVAVPDKNTDQTQDMDERRIVSMVLGKGEVVWYHGAFENPLKSPQHVHVEGQEVRMLLQAMQTNIQKLTNGKDMIVLIKPSSDARTKDIINALDEMKISNTKRYVLSKISPQEEQLLLAKN